MEKYYKSEALNDLSAELCEATDTLKHLVVADKELMTSELLQSYKDLKGSCQDYITALDYYADKL